MSSPWTPFHTSNYGTPDWHIPGDDAPERDGDSSSQSSRSSDSGSSGYSSAGHPRYTRRILRERIAWNEPLIDVGSEHVDVVSPRASPLSQAPSPGALSSRASRSHSVPRSRDEIFLHDEQPLWRSRASSMDARADVLGQAGADPAQASSSPMRQRSPSFPPRDATNDDQSLTALLTSHGKPGFRCQVVGCEKSGKVFSKRGLKDHRRWYHTNKFSVTTAAGDIFTVQRTASGQLHCPIEGCNRSFKHPTHLQGHAKACVLGDQLPVPARNAPNIPDKDRVLYVISDADKTKHTIGYDDPALAHYDLHVDRRGIVVCRRCGVGLDLESLDAHFRQHESRHRLSKVERERISARIRSLADAADPQISLVQMPEAVKDQAVCRAHSHDGDDAYDPDAPPLCCYMGGSNLLPAIPGIAIWNKYACAAPDCQQGFVSFAERTALNHVTKEHGDPLRQSGHDRLDWVRRAEIQTVQLQSGKRRWYEIKAPRERISLGDAPLVMADVIRSARLLAGQYPAVDRPAPVRLLREIPLESTPAYVSRLRLLDKLRQAGLVGDDSDEKFILIVMMVHGWATDSDWKRAFRRFGGLSEEDATRRAASFQKEVVNQLRRARGDRLRGDQPQESAPDPPVTGLCTRFYAIADGVLSFYNAEDKNLVGKFRGSLERHVKLGNIKTHAEYSDPLAWFLALLLFLVDVGPACDLHRHVRSQTAKLLVDLRKDLKRLEGINGNRDDGSSDGLDANPTLEHTVVESFLPVLSSVILVDNASSPPDVFAPTVPNSIFPGLAVDRTEEVLQTFSILNVFVIARCLRIPPADRRLERGLDWSVASQVSTPLSKITYMVRLAAFLKVHQVMLAYSKLPNPGTEARDRERDDAIERITYFVNDQSPGSRAYAFLRALVAEVGRDAKTAPGSLPSVAFQMDKGDPTVLLHSSSEKEATTRISLGGLQGLVDRLCQGIDDMLRCELLRLMPVPVELEPQSWKGYQDPLRNPDKTFLDAMGFGHRFQTTLYDHLVKSSVDEGFRARNRTFLGHTNPLFELEQDGSTVRLDYSGCQTWFENLARFDSRLMTLVHVSSGMPARGTEWAPIGKKSIRWFPHLRHFGLIFRYNKTRTLFGDKLILRFLHPVVARFLIIRAVLLGPAAERLHHAMVKADGDRGVYVPDDEFRLRSHHLREGLFAAAYGDLMASNRFSGVFPQVTKQFGYPMTVSNFRQAIIALLENCVSGLSPALHEVRSHLGRHGDSDEDDDEPDVRGTTSLQRQAGHTLGTAGANYGRIEGLDVEGVPKQLLDSLFMVSAACHKLLFPPSKSEKRAASHPNSGITDELVSKRRRLGVVDRADSTVSVQLNHSPPKTTKDFAPIASNVYILINTPATGSQNVTPGQISDSALSVIAQAAKESDFPFNVGYCGLYGTGAGTKHVLRAAATVLGVDVFTPRSTDQFRAIQLVAGNAADVLYVAPTGYGKTLPHQVFAQLTLERNSTDRTFILVFVPLRAIASKFAEWCKTRTFNCEIFDAATDYGRVEFEFDVTLRGRIPTYIVATPDQMVNPRAFRLLQKIGPRISLIVVDEVDNVIRDWEWRNSMGTMFRARNSIGAHNACLLATTATLSPGGGSTFNESALVRLLFGLGVTVDGAPSRPFVVVRESEVSRKEIRYEVQTVATVFKTDRNGRPGIDRSATEDAVAQRATDYMVEALGSPDIARELQWTRTLVFAKTIRQCQQVYEKVPEALRSRVALFNGQLEPIVSQRILADFESGSLDALITTDAIKSGFHPTKPVGLVINYLGCGDMAVAEQRVGRGGRDGLPVRAVDVVDAQCMTLPTDHNWEDRGDLVRAVKGVEAYHRHLLLAMSPDEKLKQMRDYYVNPLNNCRRYHVSSHFGGPELAVSCRTLPQAELCDRCALDEDTLLLDGGWFDDGAGIPFSVSNVSSAAPISTSFAALSDGIVTGRKAAGVERLWANLPSALRALGSDRAIQDRRSLICAPCLVTKGQKVPLHGYKDLVTGDESKVVQRSTESCPSLKDGAPSFCWICTSRKHKAATCAVASEVKVPTKYCGDCGLSYFDDTWHVQRPLGHSRICRCPAGGRFFVKLGFLIAATVQDHEKGASKLEILNGVKDVFGSMESAQEYLDFDDGDKKDRPALKRLARWVVEVEDERNLRLRGWSLAIAYLTSRYFLDGGRLSLCSW